MFIVFVFHKTHAIRNLGSSQSCCFVKSTNVFRKEKKIVSLFFVKAKTKEGKKAFSCEFASGNKGSFCNQDEWLQEIKEHERKLDMSESSRISPASLLTRKEFREKDVSFIV